MNQVDKIFVKNWRDILFGFFILFVVYELKFNHPKLIEEKINSLNEGFEKSAGQEPEDNPKENIDQVNYENLTKKMDNIVTALKIMNSENSSNGTKLDAMAVNFITMNASIETIKEEVISISTDAEMINIDLDKIRQNLK